MTVQAIIVRGTKVAAQVISRGTPGTKGDPGSPGEGYATRTALAARVATNLDDAYLTEAGREGKFVFSTANLSTQVSADTKQGIYIAPASDTTGASGAWERQFGTLPINPEWFGVIRGDAAGANTTANNAALAAMKATLVALAVNSNGTTLRGLFDVEFGLATYEISQTFDFDSGMMGVRGRGGLAGLYTSTVIKAYGCTAFRIQGTNTSGASTKDATAHFTGSRSPIRDLSIAGDFSGTEAEYHGVHARGTLNAQNVYVYNMRGDGFRLDGDTGALGGDATASILVGCEAWNCRDGFAALGNNVSATTVIGGVANNNRRWGANDQSTLGIVWVGTQGSANGVTSYNDGIAIGASVVSYSGNAYYAIAGQETGASTNAPSGTTVGNQWWGYYAAGGAATGRPAWFSGILVRAGGIATAAQITGHSVFSGCYAEQNQGKAQIAQRSMASGGMLSGWVYAGTSSSNYGVSVGAESGKFRSYGQFESFVAGGVTAGLGENGANVSNNTIFYGIHSTYAPSVVRLRFSGTTSPGDLKLDYGGSTVFYWLTGPTTAQQFGTGAPFPYAFWPGSLILGPSFAAAREFAGGGAAPTTGNHGSGEWVIDQGTVPAKIGWKCTAAGSPGTWSNDLYASYRGSAAPTTGSWLRGDVMFNSLPAVGQPKGWQCTASGTPGTWVSMGNL